MNDIDKRLDAIQLRNGNFQVTHADVKWLIDNLKAEREEKERLKERIEKMKPEWVKNNSLALKQLQQYEKALKEIIEYYPEGNHVREIAKSALGGDRE